MFEFLRKIFTATPVEPEDSESLRPSEQLEQAIFAELEKRFPGGHDWQERNFHCFASAPAELRMFPAFAALEYNLDNGGWPQLLWNCCGSWRALLDICEAGYITIGATQQAKVIPLVRDCLQRHEQDCAELMRRAEDENDFSYFGKFCQRIVTEPTEEWMRLFYYTSDINERRLTWLEGNADQIRALLQSSW